MLTYTHAHTWSCTVHIWQQQQQQHLTDWIQKEKKTKSRQNRPRLIFYYIFFFFFIRQARLLWLLLLLLVVVILFFSPLMISLRWLWTKTKNETSLFYISHHKLKWYMGKWFIYFFLHFIFISHILILSILLLGLHNNSSISELTIEHFLSFDLYVAVDIFFSFQKKTNSNRHLIFKWILHIFACRCFCCVFSH